MILMIEALEARIKHRKETRKGEPCACGRDDIDHVCARCMDVMLLNEDLTRVAHVRAAIADLAALAERYDKA